MRFGELHVRSHARSNNHRSCDHSVTIAFFFDVNLNKQLIVKSYLQLGKKPFNPMGKREENQCFYECKEPPSPIKRMK